MAVGGDTETKNSLLTLFGAMQDVSAEAITQSMEEYEGHTGHDDSLAAIAGDDAAAALSLDATMAAQIIVWLAAMDARYKAHA